MGGRKSLGDAIVSGGVVQDRPQLRRFRINTPLCQRRSGVVTRATGEE